MLAVDCMTLHSEELVDIMVKLNQRYMIVMQKDLWLEEDPEPIQLKNDLIPLRRILGNMMKNALKASEESVPVMLGNRKVSADMGLCEFWVWNRGVIPEEG